MPIKIPTLGADIRTLPHPTEAREASTIIRCVLAAKKESKNLIKNQASLYKTTQKPDTLYT